MATRNHASHAPRQLTSFPRSLIVTAVLLCSAGLPGAARAATYYLNTFSGSDSNPGTGSAPWQTLAKVQISAAAGDVIVIQSADVSTYAAPWPTHVSYRARVLRQFEITWTFDMDYPVGQFANRDLWVVGPVRIIGIDPPSTSVSGRIINGSVVNPRPGWVPQGYDSAMPYNPYDAALNVAYGRSAANPLILQPHSSLVSAISLPTVGGKTTLERAAILTVLTAPAHAGDFRPPYCGSDKTPRFNAAMLNRSLLRTLPPTAATPALSAIEAMFAAPWIDHGAGWLGDQQHPRKNMPDYGREMHTQIGTAALMLHLNFSLAQKETLLIRFVQLGLDLHGVVANGGTNNWPNAGGHGGGRKWPILFAGLMLDDPVLKAIGAKSGNYLNQNGYGAGKVPPDYIHFGEDDQTFYVAQVDVDATNSSLWRPDSRDTTRLPYQTADLGLPEWGIERSTDPYQSNKSLWTMYRNVAGPPLHGTALAALLMPGAKALWNHDAHFDYTDRYMKMTAPGEEFAGWWRSMSAFTASMWDTYRAQCGPIWPAAGGTGSAPVLASIGAQQIATGATLTFGVAATGGSGPLVYSAAGLPTGATFAGQTFTWTPGATQTGSYAVTFTVSDGQVQDSETVAIAVTNTNAAPVLAAIGNQAVAENQLLSFTVSATDPDGNPLTYSATGLPEGASLTGASFAWTPTFTQAGSYPVTFRVSDGQAQDTETVTIAVANVNRPPVLADLGSLSVDAGNPLSFTLAATDPDGDSLTYGIDTLPNGATLTGAAFAWTPTSSQAGFYTITFTASDGALTDSGAAAIVVTQSNVAPVLATIGDKSVHTDETLTFSISATDADGGSLAYSATGLPGGAGLTGQTFTWTPTAGQAGSYPVTFVASDGQAQDAETVTIQVTLAAAGATQDRVAPAVEPLSPDADAIQVALNHLVTLHITDANSGVDANSVAIRVNGHLVYQGNTDVHTSDQGRCRRWGTKQDYRFEYQAEAPFDFDQTVAVRVQAADLAGNAMSEYAYSFATQMRSFGRNLPVSALGGYADSRPATARDPAGNLWFAWHAGAVGSRDIYVASLPAGASAFPSPVRLTNDNRDQCNPALTVSPAGAVYVVWQDNRNGHWDLYASVGAEGANFSKEVQVTNSDRNEVLPALAVDRQSPACVYIAWQDDRNGNQDVYVATTTNAFASTAIAQITASAADQMDPALAVDGDNLAYVFWTDTRSDAGDIYGAASAAPGAGQAWIDAPIATGAGEQSRPAVAAAPAGSGLHLLWVDSSRGDGDIHYAALHGLPETPVPGVNIVDDTSGAEQTAPALVCGADGRVFAGWQDARHADGGSDTDLYLAELRAGSAGINVFVGDDATNVPQSEPALGVDRHGQPYLVWTDGRRTTTEIYYAATTFVDPVPLHGQLLTAADGLLLGTDPAAIDSLDDLSLLVPPGACQADLDLTISRVLNPPLSALALLGSYEFGPSGVAFAQPVTVTIPYSISGTGRRVLPYWYDALTGALSQQGITDIQTLTLSSRWNALRFRTTHFTSFYLVETDAEGVPLDGGSSGGGCALSTTDDGSPAHLFVPYTLIALIMLILRRRDRGNRLRTWSP